MNSRLRHSKGFGCRAVEQSERQRCDQAQRLNQAHHLLHSGLHAQAETIYMELLSEGCKEPTLLLNLSGLHISSNRHDAAEPLLRQVLKLKPGSGIAYNNLGMVYSKRGEYGLALKAHRQAVYCSPDVEQFWLNLGIALQEVDEIDASLQAFLAALERDPCSCDAQINLGRSYQRLGRLGEATQCFLAAIGLDDQHADAHVNLASAFLLAGQEQQGLKEYEWRLRCPAGSVFAAHAQPLCPRWHGESPEVSGPLLVVSEQGLGDTLQFVRYVSLLLDLGYSVRLCVQAKLQGLLEQSGFALPFFSKQQALACSEGVWVPLLSLPYVLGGMQHQVVSRKPYLHVCDAAQAVWRSRLVTEKRPVIGLNWQGEPSSEVFHLKGRSMVLECLAPLASVVPGQLLSLQKGSGSEQLLGCSFADRFVAAQSQVNQAWGFIDTAAIVLACDLVITTDTAMAHLAGGLGVPTWLLLKQVPDWRWGLEGDSTPWYPNVRLFRQQPNQNWHDVIRAVVQAVEDQVVKS